ncbi:hypothetical protein IW262DRAFT_1454669 [Armillaria fumosa]|nr:hypothetical protein IW262DRAFT_1454669 [Armillaria fumosa]
MQEYKKLLLSACRLTHDRHDFLLKNMNDYLHAIFDGRRKAWWSLFLPQFIALYPDTVLDQRRHGTLAHQWSVRSLQEHLEEWMDRNGSALAKDGYAIERHIFRAREPQALECCQDEQSMGTEQLTLEGSVSDGSDGTVDTSTTAQIRRWRASISETMDSAVDQGLESKIAFIVELRERRNEARHAAIALWAANVYEEQDQSV